ncbi:hypothetical protein RSAG8_07435, partial [Rhizoctonia solani AG-8 WAC10335]
MPARSHHRGTFTPASINFSWVTASSANITSVLFLRRVWVVPVAKRMSKRYPSYYANVHSTRRLAAFFAGPLPFSLADLFREKKGIKAILDFLGKSRDFSKYNARGAR